MIIHTLIHGVSVLICKGGFMKDKIFWIFGVLQSLSLSCVIFFIFQGLSFVKGERIIGLDSQILLSVAFPLFLLITEYIIYKKD